MQSFKKIGIKLYEELRSQGTHCHNTHRIIESEVTKKFHKVEKVTKINSRIISKPHAHLQTMVKTCAKFQKDRYIKLQAMQDAPPLQLYPASDKFLM